MLAPLIEDLAKEYEGRIKVGKVNVDEQQELAMKYRVVSIPTLVLFREGQAVNRLVGAVPKGRIEEMLNA